MSDHVGLTDALRNGAQADMDGCFVKVSRQACEEAADLIEAQAARIAELEAALRNVSWMGEGYALVLARAESAEAEAARLRGAMEQIAATPARRFQQKIARAALTVQP